MTSFFGDDDDNQVLSQQELLELDRQEKRTAEEVESKFIGKPWGRCGCNMFRWFCQETLSCTCCLNSDWINFFVFFVAFIGCFPIFITYFSNLESGDTVTIFFIALGWGLGTIAWAFVQWAQILNYRQELAEIADDITLVRKTTQSITETEIR